MAVKLTEYEKNVCECVCVSCQRSCDLAELTGQQMDTVMD